MAGEVSSLSLVKVNASRAVQRIRYFSSDDHINTLYFRLGDATESLDSCHLKRSNCYVSAVAAIRVRWILGICFV